MQMDFGEVLSRAWQIVWKHKVLWVFGILASCSNANGGAGNARTSFQGDVPPSIERFFDQFGRVPDWQIALLVGAVILVILLLVVLAIFLSTVGRIGLIQGTLKADQGAESLAFGELFGDSTPYFWRIFGLNLIVGIAAVVLVLLILAPFIFFGVATLGVGFLCLIPLICIFVPLFWLLNLVVEQANIAIVVEDVGIFDGLRRAWEIFKTNLGSILVMGLILSLGVNLIAGFIIALPLAFIVSPAIIGAIAGTDQTIGGGLLIAALCFVAYLPVLLILSGALRSYIESAWTLTFLRLTRGAAMPGQETFAEAA
jgi:hypothetical protein